MNKNITLPALLLAAVATVGFILPGTAAARDNHSNKRAVPSHYAHADRHRHDYRQHRSRQAPRWMHHYQRHQAYGHHYRPWKRYPGFFADKHALKKHYRRMEQHRHHQPRYDRRHYGRHNDSNIHFRIDYWD